MGSFPGIGAMEKPPERPRAQYGVCFPLGAVYRSTLIPRRAEKVTQAVCAEGSLPEGGRWYLMKPSSVG